MARALLMAAAVGALALATAEAADWPAKSVRIIVPFAAGGGGSIGTEAVAHAEADGHTLLVSGIPVLVLGPAMNKSIGYDPIRDFTHIAYFGGTPNVLVVHPALGVRSYRDFLARVRAEKSATQYVSAGVGTMGNWVAEYLAAKENISLTHIAYKGGSAAVLDLVAGHVKVGMLSLSSIADHIRAGTLVALAVSAAERLPGFPDLPTLRELGNPDFVATTWFSLSGPAGMSPATVDSINRETVKAMDRPQLRRQIEQDGIETKAMTPAEVTSFVQTEIGRWSPIVNRMIGAK